MYYYYYYVIYIWFQFKILNWFLYQKYSSNSAAYKKKNKTKRMKFTYPKILYTLNLVNYALFYSNTKTFFVFLFFYARAAL